MLPNAVYQLEGEVDRLATQNHLFKEYETPVYQRILSQYDHPRILDVGCNNGTKSVDRFNQPNIEAVIGLEFHSALAQQAQAQWGDSVFSFHPCDVEDPSFAHQLSTIMHNRQVEAFDVIHISLVLLHLTNPCAVLHALRKVLAPKGQLLIVEPDDSLTHAIPDPEGLCQGFVSALDADPYSGRRDFVSQLPSLLSTCGYERITVEPQLVAANYDQLAKKAAIFDIFCSFILDDALLVSPEMPWAKWIASNGAAFKALMVAPESQITVGFTLISCFPCDYFLSPMLEEEATQVSVLCDRCAGENLYTKELLTSICHKPNHYINVLRTQEGDLAGYSYCNIVDIDTVAAYSKLDPALFQGLSPVAQPGILNLQATGVAPVHRRHHLSERIIDYALSQYTQADIAFGLCWRPFGTPDHHKTAMEHALLARGFQFLANAQDVWADSPGLICPFCNDTCHCTAAAYYRPIQQEKE